MALDRHRPLDSKSSGVIWISHRGLRTGGAIENTAAAFRQAVAGGFTHLETDLRMCRDGAVALSHDVNLQSLYGDGRPVAAMTRREIEALGGGRDPPMFFDQLVEEFSNQNWTLDIKPETAPAVIEFLARGARRSQQVADVLVRARFLTWSPAHTRRLLAAFPDAFHYARKGQCQWAATAVILGFPGCAAIQSGRTYALFPRLAGAPLLTPNRVAEFHRRQARVLAFLPKNPADTRNSLAAGADEILTDGEIV